MDTREIYSIQDGVDVLEKLLKEELGLGYNTVCAITDQFRINFLYINWIRFQRANCVGCVSGPEECDVAYGRNEYRGSYDKIKAGQIQSCPARVNGTMMVERGKGIESVDLADHKFNVVVEEGE